jgi:hypothetical protein
MNVRSLYRNRSLLVAAHREWLAEEAAYVEIGCLPPRSPVPLDVSERARRFKAVEELRRHHRVMRQNRVALLYPQQAFELLGRQGDARRSQLTLQPNLLDPERVPLLRLWHQVQPDLAQGLVQGLAWGPASLPAAVRQPGPAAQGGLASPEQLLTGPATWGRLTGLHHELSVARDAFVGRVVEIATELELFSLGLWFPTEKVRPGNEELRRRFGQLPAPPRPLPEQERLHQLFWADGALIAELDRRAGLAFGFQGGGNWWSPAPPGSPSREPRWRSLDLRRIEAVTATIDALPGVVARCAENWHKKLSANLAAGKPAGNWRGWVLLQARKLIQREIARIEEAQQELESSIVMKSRPRVRMASAAELELSQLPLPDRNTGPQAVRSTQLSWLVAHATRDLGETELLVLVLRYFMGRQQQPMPRNEVATLLGMPDEGAVRTVEERALRKLRGAVRVHYRPWDETSDSETGDHDARDRGANH